jgi:transcriptional regulator with XRE-family HTH domain
LSGKSSLAAEELYAIANALNVPIETFRPEKLKGGTH